MMAGRLERRRESASMMKLIASVSMVVSGHSALTAMPSARNS